MAKTHEEKDQIIAELAAEVNTLRNDAEASKRGQDAMFVEAKRLSEELTRLKTDYAHVPRELFAVVDLMPGIIRRARPVYPGIASIDLAQKLTYAEEHWNEIEV